ncbi:NF-X1-type zinc finger protein [Actinidia chinensis var. chinensis]|uniref:NF-X1-type zinc finger protein n=1 Tax=Actinidia chinensis var. chinensis TaxID=1590841 RepID=A0A2R6RTF7_ACTCC|nr:NF-X1-type zinc finger protein [Actinidia chinensis var. chinensis]
MFKQPIAVPVVIQKIYPRISMDLDCRSKIKVADTNLQHHKSTVSENKEPDAENYALKRTKESTHISRLQRITTAMWRILLLVTLLLALVITAYYGYSGLLWLFNWMNEVKVLRQRRSLGLDMTRQLTLHVWKKLERVV